MTRILDGTGHGNVAKVDSVNRLWTNAIAEREISAASKQGDAYLFPTLLYSAVPAGTEHLLLRLKNNKVGHNFHCNKLFVAWNGGNTNYNRPCYGHMYGGTAEPTAGNVLTEGGNLNQSSAKTSDMAADIWNGVTAGGMTVTSNGDYKNAMMTAQGYFIVDIEGSLILGPGDILGMSLTPEETGDCQIAMSGWFVEI